jgi:hypothetical protein
MLADPFPAVHDFAVKGGDRRASTAKSEIAESRKNGE